MVNATVSSDGPEPIADKFVAAWEVFARTCGQYLAPEATYQAWFAHYLISQFGVDRVAREPGIKHKHFVHEPWSAKVRGSHVRLDAVVTRTPGIHLPRYSPIYRSGDTTGLGVLRRLAVISELKVAATTGEGLDHTEVARDVWKLSLLLSEYERVFPGQPTPLAFACVLDNHPTRTYRWDYLDQVIDATGKHQGVTVLKHAAATRPTFSMP